MAGWIMALVLVCGLLLQPMEVGAGDCLERGLWPAGQSDFSLAPAMAPEKALDLSIPDPSSPPMLSLWSGHGGDNQTWTIYLGLSDRLPGSWMVSSRADRRCLVFRKMGTLNLEIVTVDNCDSNNPFQRWCFNSLGGGAVRIRNFKQGGCLTFLGNLRQEGVKVGLSPCDGSASQRWLLR